MDSRGVQTTLVDDEQIQPWDVAVDGTGAVYYNDLMSRSVFELAPGSTAPQAIYTFPDRGQQPFAIAAAPDGTVVVSAVITGNTSAQMDVWRFAPGSPTPTMLPFPKESIGALAITAGGDIYASAQQKVWKLPAGAAAATQLPITPRTTRGVAVSNSGDVYVSDAYGGGDPDGPLGPGNVLVLRAGATTPTVVPFTGSERTGTDRRQQRGRTRPGRRGKQSCTEAHGLVVLSPDADS
ncbi:hypothetical protein [Nocardia sp. GCM10030253]|uniref:hypothetical protein n=1 Tax=Nocardia sp. GCM10030253 TaxID=3273404 RepID=UPI003672A6EE